MLNRDREQAMTPPRRSAGALLGRFLLHTLFLLIAIGCLAGYEHFRVEGQTNVALGALVAAGLFGFAPVRDLLSLVFGLGGRTLHLIHALGALGLAVLPLSGMVSGAPVLTHAATAPFAMMAAAQAVMHQNHPRNPAQAVALQRFAASIPEVARFAGGADLTSPANARRAVAALADILSKAQALGQTELAADPRYQSAVARTSTGVGAKLGLDVVDLAIARLAANPATAGAVPPLRRRLDQARRTFAVAAAR
jgi:hypothetical protein